MRGMRTIAAALVLVGITATQTGGTSAGARTEIEAFNRKFVELHLKMDHAGVLAMWAEDGVDLMPGETPLIGKKAITAWIQDIESRMTGHKVTEEAVEFHDIQISGDWASEWATEHQVVQLPEGKPPIDGYGKLVLVLNREGSGEWKIKQEMWNDAPHP